MGDENNWCKTDYTEIVLLLMSLSQMAYLSNIYIGVIGVPLAQDNQ